MECSRPHSSRKTSSFSPNWSSGSRAPAAPSPSWPPTWASARRRSTLRSSAWRRSRLIAAPADGGRPIVHAVEEFLIYGLKYVFPAQRGEVTRGIPTAHAAPPLNRHFAPGADLPPVWPDPEGEVRGTSLDPLHKMVPAAVRKDPALYELLALVEALRDGRARERQLAERELATRLRRLLHG